MPRCPTACGLPLMLQNITQRATDSRGHHHIVKRILAICWMTPKESSVSSDMLVGMEPMRISDTLCSILSPPLRVVPVPVNCEAQGNEQPNLV